VRTQWLEKDVDLRLLTEGIATFFHETDFETTLEEMREGYVIQARSKIPNLQLRIEAHVVGQPHDFVVEFLSEERRGIFSPSMLPRFLASLFGGGYLVLRETRKQELLDTLEKDFWKHVQMQVADLANSATNKGVGHLT
jgi:hypothetical protein